LVLTAANGRIVAAENACALARPQFLAAGGGEGVTCFIVGQPATLEQAVRRAAEILLSAQYPLVWGLGRATCEAQAAAVEIAERSAGVVDLSGAGDSGAGDLEALQTVGQITCTLGELRSRADMLVVWNADPATAQPRFFERYGPPRLAESHGCPLIVVDSRLTPTAAAGRHLRIHAGREFESATVLWSLAKRLALEPERVATQTGVPLAEWRTILASMEQSRYGAILFDHSFSNQSFLFPLFGLVRTLNERTRCVCLRLGGAANSAGAEQVLSWRTGYSRNVDFSHGYPRFNPTDFSAERLLERSEVDAALVVCDDPQTQFSSAALARLRKIPTVLVDWKETPAWSGADVSIRIAVPGVESPGTMFRLDGVPLTLRPAIGSSSPADFEVLRMLADGIGALGSTVFDPAAQTRRKLTKVREP
jgi:formylmethanofuran dehydrogenase subunit B